MRDDFDDRLSTVGADLERAAAIRPPTSVRARGDERRRHRTLALTVVPVAVLAIAGGVGLGLRPSGASIPPGPGGTPPPSSQETRPDQVPTAPVTSPTSPTSKTPPTATSKTTAPAAVVDLAHHTMSVFDGHGVQIRTLKISGGSASHPTPTGTFTVVDKKPSASVSSQTAVPYSIGVSSFIDLGPKAGSLYAAPWQNASFGLENVSHGDVELGTDDASWLYSRVSVGDKIQIIDG
jgi:lipoprotein-anchoring transpeptidase ErfK/SrfK